MKKKITACLAAIVCMLLSVASFAQEPENPAPAWVSNKGYWVVESNLHQPLTSKIIFYNNDNIKVGTREITGKKLNVRRRKIKMQLKSMLEASLLEWAAIRRSSTSTDLAQQPL